MAVPNTVNIKNLAGTYSLNKEKSGDTDSVLYMQGINWVIRQAIKWSAVTVKVTQHVDDKGITNLELVQTSSGVVNMEPRTLDWESREKDDLIFGKVTGRMKFAKLSEIENDFLKQEIDAKADDDTVIYAENESIGLGNEWKALQLWGFQVEDGERRHVRRVVVTRGDQTINLVTFYDWIQPTQENLLAEEDEQELPGA